MTSEYEKCPVCGSKVRARNLAGHLEEVHPRQARQEDIQAARRGRKRQRSAAATIRRGFPWRIVAAVAVAAVTLVAAYYAISVLTNRPFDPFSCVENVGVRRANFHVYMNISNMEIPGDIGIRPGCTGIIHTHSADALEDGRYRKVHYEGPLGHAYTVGEFFQVWGVPFSATTLGPYTATPAPEPGAKLYMTVNNDLNTEYDRYVLSSAACVTFDTCTHIEIAYNP